MVINMLYQKPMNAGAPYSAYITEIDTFPIHRHYEVEIIYCIKGKITAEINGVSITVCKGDTLFVGSFIPHAYEAEKDSVAMVTEFGYALLKDDFLLFSNLSDSFMFFKSDSAEISAATEIAEILQTPREHDLRLLSLLYKLADELLSPSCVSKNNTDKNSYNRILPALRLIHLNYSEPLRVEDACRATALSPGNFCTLFKNTFGMGFHAYLNAHRVRNAGYLLKQTELSIDEVAQFSGFADKKTFYRLFKKHTGTTPKAYREN